MISKFTLCIFTLLSLFSFSGCTSISHKIGLAECAPVYGNWCGENYPLEGENPKPVDGWDIACKDHDKCYADSSNRKKCDDKLLKSFEELDEKGIPVPQRIVAAYSWFKPDGYVGGFFAFEDESWSMSADCKGGDGKTEVHCVISEKPTISYRLNPKVARGLVCPYTYMGRDGLGKIMKLDKFRHR